MNKEEEIPYFAIGNNELRNKPVIGKFAICPNCGKKHKVKYGKTQLEDGTWVESKLLGFVNCGKNSYLVSVEGKKI